MDWELITNIAAVCGIGFAVLFGFVALQKEVSPSVPVRICQTSMCKHPVNDSCRIFDGYRNACIVITACESGKMYRACGGYEVLDK